MEREGEIILAEMVSDIGTATSPVPPVWCERALAARAQNARRNRAHAF